MGPSVPALLPFPQEAQLARAHFEEAARHLQDARILHINKRYAGAITSEMKAVELGLKSVLIVYGASRWLSNALNTHAVLDAVKKESELTKSLQDALTNHDAALISDIELLERLVPNKPDVKKLEMGDAANTEYPFAAFISGSAPSSSLTLYTPGTHFQKADSERHFRTAYRLLTALEALSPEVRSWRIRLCRSL